MTDFYTQKHTQINDRNVWLHLISCPIGNIFIVQHEERDFSIKTFFFFNVLEDAEKKYRSICTKMIKEDI